MDLQRELRPDRRLVVLFCGEEAGAVQLLPGCPVGAVTHFIQRASARQHWTSLDRFLTETMMEQVMRVKERISKICKKETVQTRRRNTFRYRVEKIRHGPALPVQFWPKAAPTSPSKENDSSIDNNDISGNLPRLAVTFFALVTAEKMTAAKHTHPGNIPSYPMPSFCESKLHISSNLSSDVLLWPVSASPSRSIETQRLVKFNNMGLKHLWEAGHLPGLQTRLEAESGFDTENSVWQHHRVNVCRTCVRYPSVLSLHNIHT